MIEIQFNWDSRNKEHKKGYADSHCIICGKPAPSPKHFIRVFYGDRAVTNAEALEIIGREGIGGDLGLYPIGASCLKQRPELRPYADDAARTIELETVNEAQS